MRRTLLTALRHAPSANDRRVTTAAPHNLLALASRNAVRALATGNNNSNNNNAGDDKKTTSKETIRIKISDFVKELDEEAAVKGKGKPILNKISPSSWISTPFTSTASSTLPNGDDKDENNNKKKTTSAKGRGEPGRKPWNNNPNSLRLPGRRPYPVRGPGPMPEKRLKEVVYATPEISISPRKLNLVAELIRGLPVSEAALQLQYSGKRVSREALQALNEAVAKAKKLIKLDREDLVVGQAYVGGRIVGHKPDIKGRGRMGTIQKRVSRLKIHLYQHPKLVEGFHSKRLAHLTYVSPRQRRRRDREKEKSTTISSPPAASATMSG